MQNIFSYLNEVETRATYAPCNESKERFSRLASLQFVVKSVERGDRLRETLPESDLVHQLLALGVLVQRAGRKDLPMVEDALREGLATGGRSQMSDKAKGLVDGQVSLDLEHGGAWDLGLFVDVATPLVEDAVDTADGRLGALDLDLEDGLQESGFRGQHTSVEDTPGGGHDLASTPMDGVGVEGDIVDVEAAASHVLVGEDTLEYQGKKNLDHIWVKMGIFEQKS